MNRTLKNWICICIFLVATLNQSRSDSMTYYGELAENKIDVSDLKEGVGRARGKKPNLYVISTNYVFEVICMPAHGWQPWSGPNPEVGNDGKLAVKIPDSEEYELVSCTFATKEEIEEGVPVDIETVTVNLKRIEVEQIKVSSASSGNGNQEFEGHKEWKFEPKKNPDPGKHLVVFFKDVANEQLEVEPFTVELEAKLNPASVPFYIFDKTWKKVSGNSGSLTSPKYGLTQFKNPNQGGVYKIKFDLGLNDFPSEANIVLPLAGAEMKNVVANDLIKADVFAQKVVAKYDWFQRQLVSNGKKWFVNNKVGDYLGRPDNKSNPTVWLYNEVDDQGFGAVATWFGVPVRIAKISNFIVAYATRKIGVNPVFAWMSQVIGSFNDSAASKSWDAGWEVAGGASYTATASAMVKDIYDEVVDPKEKHLKLWPNSSSANNQQPSEIIVDYDFFFCSPKFTETENP